MSSIKVWVNAMRIRTLPLSVSGIILGSGVAYFNGFGDITILILSLITTILFQVLSNFANDLGDSIKGTDNVNRIGPIRSVQSGAISRNEMKKAVILTAILSLLSASSLIYYGVQGMRIQIILFYIILAILCIIAAITYTIGKKAYGYYGLGDLMVLLFFGGVSVLGVYSLYSKSFLWDNILLSLFVGLMSVAVLNLNNMRDYKNDLNSGKNTLVVNIGPNYAKFYQAFLIVIALISLVLFINKLNEPILYSSLLPAIVYLFHLRRVMRTQHSKYFDPELKIVALTTFFISLVVSIGMIFI